MNILVFNAGSSSLKFCVYESRHEDLCPIAAGSVGRIGTKKSDLVFELSNGRISQESIAAETHVIATQKIFEKLSSSIPPEKSLDAIGCRVVHGGALFVEPVIVNEEVLKNIRHLSALAPLHNPVDANIIEICQGIMPNVPVVAVFDTSFHHAMPERAAIYALPGDVSEKYALRRYGFHGIAHQNVSEQLLKLLNRRISGTNVIT